MLVICEDCAKKYSIDESRIKGRRARFTCNACGHIIIVDKDDLTRSLLTGKTVGSPSPTLDLLREMETPLAAGAGDAAGQQQPEEPPVQEVLIERKNRGIPVFVSFITGMLLLLVCGSLIFAFLYSGHLEAGYLAEAVKRQPDMRSQLFLEAMLYFGAAWTIILVLFCIVARSLHGRFNRLVENANQLSIGDYEVVIDTKGPREIRDLAFSLERVRARLKSGVREG